MRRVAVLGGLVLAGSGVWRFAAASPVVAVELWQLVTYTGVALLGIGLVRDLKVKCVKCFAAFTAPKRTGEKLICLESLSGVLCVAAGLALCALGMARAFEVEAATLAMYGGVLLVASDFIKDIVVVFRRDPDHENLVPW